MMVMVRSATMVALHLAVFIKRKYVPYITGIESDALPLGFSGKLGSKGAVSVSFKLAGQSMLFINCHLNAHWQDFEMRNMQWIAINRYFVHKKKDPGAEKPKTAF